MKGIKQRTQNPKQSKKYPRGIKRRRRRGEGEERREREEEEEKDWTAPIAAKSQIGSS